MIGGGGDGGRSSSSSSNSDGRVKCWSQGKEEGWEGAEEVGAHTRARMDTHFHTNTGHTFQSGRLTLGVSTWNRKRGGKTKRRRGKDEGWLRRRQGRWGGGKGSTALAMIVCVVKVVLRGVGEGRGSEDALVLKGGRKCSDRAAPTALPFSHSADTHPQPLSLILLSK